MRVFVAAEGGREGPIQFICWGTTSLILYGTNIDLFASTNECVSVRVFVAAEGGREGPIQFICWELPR